MDQLDSLLRAKQGKRWGFVGVPVSNGNGTFALVDVARVDMQAHEAREWTVTLPAFKYQGGPTVPGSIVGGDTRNSTFTPPFWAAQVQWGVDGGQETALVDYPAQGCTFQLHAATVQVSIVTRFSSILPMGAILTIPLVGCFISPSRRSAIGPIANPSLTFSTIIGANTTALIAIPARAVAYRQYQTGSIALVPPAALQSVQLGAGHDGTTIPVQYDGLWPDQASFAAGAAGAADYLQANGAGYHRVNTQAQFLSIQNTLLALGPSAAVVVEFLLDLG